MLRAMKHLTPALLIAGAAFSGTSSDLNIGTRHASIYVPDKRDKPALVISMHGIGGGSWWTPGAMQYEPYADTANFVVAYPDGENSQWDLGGDKDINFLLAIIDEMAKQYDIDRDRVYVSGFSMGGMMSWYASCKIPDKIAAIIPGDGYPLGGMSGCSEVRHVPVLHIHGGADDFVSYSGLVGSFLPSQVDRYGCPSNSVRTKPYPVDVDGRNAATLANPNHSFKDYWGPCEKDGLKSEITLITVAGMGHDWATPGKICGSTDTTYDGKPYEVNGTWETVNWMLTQSLKGSGPVITIPAHRDTVANGSFDLGTRAWTFNVWGGGAQGSVVNGEYKIQIDSIGQHNSGIQLVQNGIILQQGKSYQVTFDAYAASNRTLEANVEQDVSPWTSYLPALQNFNLTTTKTTYSYAFTMTNPTDSNGRISFNAGASTETVYLDNVSIKAISASIHPTNDLRASSAVIRLDHSRLQVEFPALQGLAISVRIFDLNGKQVRSGAFRAGSGQVQSWTSDFSGMPKGVYVLGIDADGKSIHRSKFLYGD